jgi:CRISPR system Cascade subunit CasE
MYFSRITLGDDARQSSNFWNLFQTPYTLHQAICQLFSEHPNQKRDFLYRLDMTNRRPLIYSVSARLPQQHTGIWNIESKPYTPQIRVNEKLAFVLRVNPVVSKRDEDNRQHRHDVVMDLKSNLKKEIKPPVTMPSINEIAHQAGGEWLSRRSEVNGFSIDKDRIRSDSYHQEKFVKKRGGKVIQYSTLDITGELSVTDPDLLLEKLNQGIGPAKSFGCGLMLVKRI